MLQYGPILAALNTTNANTRIRIFHTRIKLRYKTTQEVTSYSILTIQLLVVCLTLVRWPKTVTAKALTLRQKEKPHGKKKKTHAKVITSPCGKKKKTHGKKKNLTAKRKDSNQKENLTAKKKKTHSKISSILREHFNSYFFCCEVVVILFAVRLFFLPWG